MKIYKADYEGKLKELDEAKAKEKELSQKLQEEKEQNNVSAIIQEEERILEMSEKQELPVDSKEVYAYRPAERNDKATETGRPTYLPIDPCQVYKIGCNNKTNSLKTSQQKRSLFISEGTENDKKQIDKSPGGFLTEIVETVAKPIYNWIMLPIYNWIVLPTYNWMILPIYNKIVLLLASQAQQISGEIQNSS